MVIFQVNTFHIESRQPKRKVVFEHFVSLLQDYLLRMPGQISRTFRMLLSLLNFNSFLIANDYVSEGGACVVTTSTHHHTVISFLDLCLAVSNDELMSRMVEIRRRRSEGLYLSWRTTASGIHAHEPFTRCIGASYLACVYPTPIGYGSGLLEVIGDSCCLHRASALVSLSSGLESTWDTHCVNTCEQLLWRALET